MRSGKWGKWVLLESVAIDFASRAQENAAFDAYLETKSAPIGASSMLLASSTETSDCAGVPAPSAAALPDFTYSTVLSSELQIFEDCCQKLECFSAEDFLPTELHGFFHEACARSMLLRAVLCCEGIVKRGVLVAVRIEGMRQCIRQILAPQLLDRAIGALGAIVGEACSVEELSAKFSDCLEIPAVLKIFRSHGWEEHGFKEMPDKIRLLTDLAGQKALDEQNLMQKCRKAPVPFNCFQSRIPLKTQQFYRHSLFSFSPQNEYSE